MIPPGSDGCVADSDRFAALVAHELKGQLVVLERYATGLESAAASGDVDRLRSDSSRIQKIARDLIETIDALRSISSPDAEAVDQTPVSLHQAATEAIEMLRDAIAAQQIHVEIAPDLPSMPGSPILWRQVYRNLIENAVKACAGVEQPRIEIGCEHRAGQTVCFVRDNGCGLDGANPLRLFDSQVAHHLTAGSGLGLFLVKQIVERAGGKVWAEGNATGTTVKWMLGD